jgi:hypothetical protein
MTMTANEPVPTWRNALSWAVIGFVFCGFVVLGAIALPHDGGVAGFLDTDAVRPKGALVSIAAALIAAAVVVGFSQRKAPVSSRTLCIYLFSNVLALGGFALAAWSYGRLAGTASPGAIDGSAKVALIVGLALLVLALACLLIVAAARWGVGLLTADQTEDTRERARAIVYSAIWMAATGLTLMLLSLAGPGGPVSPTTALAGSVGLLGVGTAVGFATRGLLDELWQALSRETGSAGFHLIYVIGGGWAILAHLGFAPAPTPLDWLIMLTLIVFAASVIATARRGLLKAR